MSSTSQSSRRPLRVVLVAALLSMGFVLVGADAARAIDGTLTITPAAAESGAPFSFSGTCTPNTAFRTFFLDAGAASILVKDGAGTSGPDGGFEVNTIVDDQGDWLPHMPPFEYPMYTRCGFDDFVEGNFEVLLPSSPPASTGVLTLSDTTPEAGQTIEVTAPPLDQWESGSGDGFVTNQDVKIVAYPGAHLLTTAVATSAGLPATSVTIPADAVTGSMTIVAFGEYPTVAPNFSALQAVAQVDGVPPTELTPLTPARLLDTRSGVGRAGTHKVPKNGVVGLDVTGVGGVPADGVGAVALNVTVTQPDGAGYVTAYPGGETRPLASNLNFVAGQSIPNLVIAKVGTGGIVNLFASSSTHLIADVVAFFPAVDDYEPLTPARMLDTRTGVGRSGTHKVPKNGVVTLDVTGSDGVPASGVGAVVLNVTVAQPDGEGYVTVYPGLEPRPGSSNLNFVKGQTIPNLVVAKVGGDGTVNFFASNTTHLIADVVGYFPVIDDFESLTPSRILDTRKGTGRAGTHPVAKNGTVALDVTGVGGVPASGVTAVILNVTVAQPAGAGYVTVYPGGETRPNASNLNYVAGQSIPNLVIAKVGSGGIVNLFTSNSTHLIGDVVGYFPAST